MNAMTSEVSNDGEGGPMWGRFFDSIGAHDDSESMVSGSHAHTDGHSLSPHDLARLQQSPRSEVHPNDSASVVDDHESALEAYQRKKGGQDIPSITGAASSVPVDDGTYVFKFRTPSNDVHRFQARHDSIEMLREIIGGKLSNDPFFTKFDGPPEEKPDPLDFALSYTDVDHDTVLMTSDGDVADAVSIARAAGSDRVVLFIRGGSKNWPETGLEKSGDSAKATSEAAIEQTKSVDNETTREPTAAPPPVGAPAPSSSELVLGIPKDLLLPASIGALAVVIIAVFTISRLTRD